MVPSVADLGAPFAIEKAQECKLASLNAAAVPSGQWDRLLRDR